MVCHTQLPFDPLEVALLLATLDGVDTVLAVVRVEIYDCGGPEHTLVVGAQTLALAPQVE